MSIFEEYRNFNVNVFTTLYANSAADDKLMIFFFFFSQTIHMKRHSLFSTKNRKKVPSRVNTGVSF